MTCGSNLNSYKSWYIKYLPNVVVIAMLQFFEQYFGENILVQSGPCLINVGPRAKKFFWPFSVLKVMKTKIKVVRKSWTRVSPVTNIQKLPLELHDILSFYWPRNIIIRSGPKAHALWACIQARPWVQYSVIIISDTLFFQ